MLRVVTIGCGGISSWEPKPNTGTQQVQAEFKFVLDGFIKEQSE